MMRELGGEIGVPAGRLAIVISRFNRTVTGALLDGALEALRSHGVTEDAIDVFWVPGAFEIPMAASEVARSGRYEVLICLGAIVRGETPHFEFISREVARGVAEVGISHSVAVGFGVLTTDSMEQALARAGEGHGNKGFEAAVVALEMCGLLRALSAETPG